MGGSAGDAAGRSGAGSSGSAGTGGAVSACASVRFQDPNLERVIRSSLGGSRAEITPAQAKQVLILEGEGAGIASLAGIECLPNLSFARLSHNQISEVTPLRALQKLEFLALSDNAVTDLSPLPELASLSNLELEGMKRTLTTGDLTAVAQIPRLQTLDLIRNTVDSFAPLAHAPLLSALYFDYGHANAPDTISYVTQLQHLSATATNLNPSELAPLTQLTELQFEWNDVSDISELTPLALLQRLDLADNVIVDISALRGMTSLNDLELAFNEVEDLTPLAGLAQLSFLDLEDNQVRTIAPLVQNSGLGLGDEVVLFEDPIDCTAEAANLKALAARQVGMGTDCGVSAPAQ